MFHECGGYIPNFSDRGSIAINPKAGKQIQRENCRPGSAWSSHAWRQIEIQFEQLLFPSYSRNYSTRLYEVNQMFILNVCRWRQTSDRIATQIEA